MFGSAQEEGGGGVNPLWAAGGAAAGLGDEDDSPMAAPGAVKTREVRLTSRLRLRGAGWRRRRAPSPALSQAAGGARARRGSAAGPPGNERQAGSRHDSTHFFPSPPLPAPSSLAATTRCSAARRRAATPQTRCTAATVSRRLAAVDSGAGEGGSRVWSGGVHLLAAAYQPAHTTPPALHPHPLSPQTLPWRPARRTARPAARPPPPEAPSSLTPCSAGRASWTRRWVGLLAADGVPPA